MNYLSLIPLALAAWASQSVSFRVGNFLVSASNNGAPVHFTFPVALAAAEAVLAGQTGSFQIGSVLITVTPVATKTN